MRILGVLAFGAALSAVGCSSSSAAPGGSGGAGASGGEGGAAQLPAQAALRINVGPSTVQAGTSCPVGAMSYELGSPGPTELNPGTSIVGGDNGALISCSVTGTGPYLFSGSVHATTAQGDPINFTLSEGSVDNTDNGSVTVSVYAPQLAGTLVSPMPCHVVVINSQVKAGAIWGEFSCDEVSRGPTADCAVNGYFVLENCDGS